MSKALPCIVCGRELKNVGPDDDPSMINQPHAGLAFTTYGHYGGTVFDPMDGQFLEINICDICLEQKGNDGKVLLGRTSRLVIADGVVVGRYRVPQQVYVPWQRNTEERLNEDAMIKVERDQVGSDIPGIVWNVTKEDLGE